MTRSLAAFCFSAAAAWAQSGISTPRAGCVVDREGSLRPLYGAASTLVPGPVARTNVLSAACSDSLAMLKTGDSLEARDASLRLLASWPAPAGPARIAFPPPGTTAWIYYPKTAQLFYLDARRALRAVALPDAFEGDVLAIASQDTQHLTALVRSDDRFRVVRIAIPRRIVEQDIEIQAGSGPWLLRRDSTLVYGDGSDIVVRRPNRAELRFPLPAPAASIDQIGEDLVEIPLTSRTAPAALRLKDGGERLLRIPEAAQ